MLSTLLALALSPSTAAFAGDPRLDKYADIQAELRATAAAHPANAELVDIGPSDSGQRIEGLRIGSGPVAHLVVATHHGNEYGSTEVARALAKSLAAEPLNGLTVFVVPVVNISGYNIRSRGEDNAQRPWDPNRDYPGPCGTEGPHHLKSTATMAAFLASSGVVATATLHTKHPAVVWPWGFGTPDLETPFTELFKAMAQAATVESKYAIGNSTEVLYPAPGTYEDYAFWKHGIWSLLFELGFTHKPALPEVDELVRVNVPGIRRMLAQAPRTRAEKHDFTGRCDAAKMKALDRHDE